MTDRRFGQGFADTDKPAAATENTASGVVLITRAVDSHDDAAGQDLDMLAHVGRGVGLGRS